jgi:hypothetical protein
MIKIIYKYSILFLIILGFAYTTSAQSLSRLQHEKDSLYQSNIKKSRLYGVYIPKDLDDAFLELTKLSGEASLQKYASVSEKVVAEKLFFGVGRWMSYNWNFDEGSRFSHYLKALGLNHPDDMVTFMLISFHRHLVKAPLNTKALVSEMLEKRKEIYLQSLKNAEVIETEIRKRQKD